MIKSKQRGWCAVLTGLLMGLSLHLSAAEVNINSASAEQIADALSGIGLVKAQEIVRFRETNGPFESVDQLVAVKGIGTGLLERNRDIVRIAATSHQVDSAADLEAPSQ